MRIHTSSEKPVAPVTSTTGLFLTIIYPSYQFLSFVSIFSLVNIIILLMNFNKTYNLFSVIELKWLTAKRLTLKLQKRRVRV